MHGRRLLDSLDVPTILTALGLIAIGLFSIASATAGSPAAGRLWRMQLAWTVVALVAGLIVFLVDYRVWAGLALGMHGAVAALLIAVLFFGKEVGGNRSWLVLGPMRLQPSEMAKWTTCLVLAVYLARRVRGSVGVRALLEMSFLVGVPMGLVARQPDMGTALIFIPLFLAALLIGRMRWKVIVGLLIVGLLLAPVAWTQLKDYQKERIRTVFEPERDPSGVGYQIRQSKIAIGSGGLIGKGPFQGTQNRLDFLPAQHTDFILAVYAEELGFVGAVIILAMFYFLFYRGVVAARSAQDRLGTYICLLVVAWLTGQTIINVGMVLGRLPTIGVPLPLVSYGGSALVTTVCGVALIVNVRTRRFVN
ncbi:MAG: rod shape-determining protein RodA [bacterium]|nr:rod shape-determining protein RodA [bacterium]